MAAGTHYTCLKKNLAAPKDKLGRTQTRACGRTRNGIESGVFGAVFVSLPLCPERIARNREKTFERRRGLLFFSYPARQQLRRPCMACPLLVAIVTFFVEPFPATSALSSLAAATFFKAAAIAAMRQRRWRLWPPRSPLSLPSPFSFSSAAAAFFWSYYLSVATKQLRSRVARAPRGTDPAHAELLAWLRALNAWSIA